ncbi:MAG: nuclear transport factor 2 family protein [Betaproteobacteria bacterium]|nr:nuclear transport factor 2 family protein [Betaproteobacteria bacterium]
MSNAKEPVSATDSATAEVIRLFNEAFHRHDAAALTNLVAEECVVENSQPAPNGSRHVGREACLALWQGIATTPGTHFEVEDIFIAGERAIVRWRYRWGEGDSNSVRGVNLTCVRDNLIVESLGYVKGK